MKYILTPMVLLCLLFSTNFSAQKLLQYNLKPGDSLKISQKANQDITQDMNGSVHNIKNILESDFTFVVKKVTDSSYIIKFKFDYFKLETSSSIYGVIMNIDTKKPFTEDDIEKKIFSGLTKSTLEMEMLKTGKIIHISGTDAMITKMVEQANVTDEFTKQLMIESMKKEFGSKKLSDSFEQMTFIYSPKKVAVGDSWKNNYIGDFKSKNTWTLNGINEFIELSAASDVSLLAEEESHTMSLTGKQQTTIKADIKTGFAKTMSVNATAKGYTVMSQMNSVKIPTTIHSITTYKINKHVQ